MNNLEFTKKEIDNDLYKRMIGKSIPVDSINEVKIENLSYLTLPHFGFDGKIHIGEMVVATEVADDIMDIFKELFSIEYRIEKMKLIDEYDGDDNKSMADNNSSGFNYRKIPFTDNLSNHARGIAIDINPLYNPYIVDGRVLPENGKEYVDRSKEDLRYIKKGDIIYNIFKNHGWSWGGEWIDSKDYQHFEKI